MEEPTQEPKNEYFAKKEQKEQEKISEHRKRQGRKTLLKIIWLVIIAAALFGVFKLVSKKGAPVPGQFFEAQSREHIDIGASHPAYNTNPPTGGWHYGAPAQTGIYGRPIPDEQIVHNLEHSHIWIAYRPDLPADQIEALADIAKSYGSRFIMTPREANDSPIAVVAWQHLLKLDGVDEQQIRLFADAYRNVAGPERNIPDFGFQDFRGPDLIPQVSPNNQNK